ncbi:MAG: hypothetical protein ACYTG5_16515 [Planctomycetota bacterium]
MPGRRAELVDLFACLVLASCVCVRGGQLEEVEVFASNDASATRPCAVVEFSAEFDLMAKRDDPGMLADEFLRVLRGTKYFESVERGAGENCISISATLRMAGNEAALFFAGLTGLSLYVIPSWGTDKIELVVELSAPGVDVREYRLEDHATTLQWLPFALVFPFFSQVEVYSDIRCNMYRHLVLRMEEDGLLAAR